MDLLRPHKTVRQLSDISLIDLQNDTINSIILDLDDTLLGYTHSKLLPENEKWLSQALASGMRFIIVSNGAHGRVQKIAGTLGLPYIGKARKPLPYAFRRALLMLNAKAQQTVVVGDQLFTDVLGARLCGLKVILTQPIVTRTELWVRAMRFCERVAFPQPIKSQRRLRKNN